MGFIIFWIFLSGGALLLCCISAIAGAERRIAQDANYSFKKLYENHRQKLT
jgi:hypothetical protein